MLDIPQSAERFSSHARARLSSVLQRAKDLVTVEDAMEALQADRVTSSKLLSRWQQQGWLKRVGRGIYAPIPLDALATEQVLKDPWILVPALYAPAYIGGWSAAEHWDFTEQLFRSIFVCTARSFRKKEQTVQGASFQLTRIAKEAIFGTKTLWRSQARVLISDKHRTIIDMLSDPASGGGIRHVDQCLRAYLRDGEANAEILIRYGDKLGNGAIFKRLGFLLSHDSAYAQLVQACKERLTQGNAKLDPALPCKRLVKAWRLWIPATWEREQPRD